MVHAASFGDDRLNLNCAM